MNRGTTAPVPATPAPASSGSLSATVDDDLVRVTGRGFWSDAVIDRHFEQLKLLAGAARRHHPRLRVLVDLRESAVQAPGTAERIEKATRQIWTPEDRIAMVVRKGLAKMQMNRIVDDQNHLTFDTIDLALAWLLQH